MSRSALFFRGVRSSLPMSAGIAPFGVIYGALAVSTGLTAWQTLGMSLLVYAGAAQFIAVTLWGAGSGVLVILVTTLIINLRHVLYSASLQPHIRSVSPSWRWLFAFWLTDETYAVVQRFYALEGDSAQARWFWLGVALSLYLCWLGSGAVGIVFGQSLPNIGAWGLEFAMLATFIGIVVPALRNGPQIMAALTAGMVAVITWQWPYKLGLIAAALTGIAAALAVEFWQESRRRGE